MSTTTAWRFRANLFGKLILQRRTGVDGPSEEWRDATTEDLPHFYAKMQEEQRMEHDKQMRDADERGHIHETSPFWRAS